MEGLQSIIRSAHCRNTHQLFAIDALRHVRSEAGQQLVRMLLRHHSRYLSGACDPDTRFRDFQNHVVHVADDNWGGAPQTAVRWYARLQQLLRDGRWGDAAHAAGVLSHYFTDPLQPLHTAHSDREAVVHRPLEWSIYQSYDAILARWRDDAFRIVFRLSTRSDWLSSAVIRGAELAHQSFETLVDTYDLEAGRRDPQRGLGEASLDVLAELCGVAITGWARVLDRTAAEADGHLPAISLGWTLLLATATTPYGWVLRRRHSKRERELVLEGLAHYHHTGEIGRYAPDDVKLLRKVLAVRDRERRFAAVRRSRPADDLPVEDLPAEATSLRVVPAETGPAETGQVPEVEQRRGSGLSSGTEHEPERAEMGLADGTGNCLPPLGKRPLNLTSPIGHAASIGPQTAARLRAIQVTTVHHLVATAPEDLIRRLQKRWPTQTRWITVETIAGWQAQTRLLVALPQLPAREARIIVAAGYRSPAALAAADLEELRGKVVRYSQTPAGRLALRGAAPPGERELRSWIRAAASASRRAA